MSTEIIRENAAVEEEEQDCKYTCKGELARLGEKMRQISAMSNAEKVKLGKRLIEEEPYCDRSLYNGKTMDLTLKYYETYEAMVDLEEALDALESAKEDLDWCDEEDEDAIAEARKAFDEAERNAADAAVELADAISDNWIEVIGDYGPIDWDGNCDTDAFIDRCVEYHDIDCDYVRAWMSEEGLFEYLKCEYLEDHDWTDNWIHDWDKPTRIWREKFLDDDYTPKEEEIEAGFYGARDRVREEAERVEECKQEMLEEAEKYADQKYDEVELVIDAESEFYDRVYRYFHDYAYKLLRI